MRKRTWLLLAALFSSAVLSLPTMAQASFFQPPRYAGPGNLFTADFNGDGKPDLLSGDGMLNLGNGNGTLIAKPKIGGTPVAVADFNADGRADVLELGTGTILVFLGNGDGTFRPPISTPSGADLSNVAVADMNGDGKPDVVGIFNYNIMVYIAKGDGTFQSGIATNTGLTSAKPLLSLYDHYPSFYYDLRIYSKSGKGFLSLINSYPLQGCGKNGKILGIVFIKITNYSSVQAY